MSESRCSGESACKSLRIERKAFCKALVSLPARCGLAHKNTSSERKLGSLSGEDRIICSQINILCSQREASYRLMRFIECVVVRVLGSHLRQW